MSETNSVVAIYDTHIQAEEAVKELQRSGFDMKKMSIVGKDYHTDEHVVGYYNTGDRMKYWGKLGAFWGGLWGMLFGAAFFAIPGIGPILVAGPLVAWIIGALEGAVVVGGLSALGAGLYSIGIPKDSVVKYEAALKSDKFLLLAHGTADEVDKARTSCRRRTQWRLQCTRLNAGNLPGAADSFTNPEKVEPIRRNIVKNNLLIVSVAGLGLVLPALASDRDDDIGRVQKATQVFQEIMRTPDKGIPQDLLEKAKCVAIVPGEEKAAFIFGGNYGKGLATCRTANGWSAPMFVAVGGGSVGFQIGASFTDVVMLFMNDHALQSLMSDKFKIGADATVAAGPVGRQAAAGTDVKLNAEILSYSRSKGAFAGVSLDGAVVQADRSGDKAMYGSNVTRQEILNGKVAVPKSARSLLEELAKYPAHR